MGEGQWKMVMSEQEWDELKLNVQARKIKKVYEEVTDGTYNS